MPEQRKRAQKTAIEMPTKNVPIKARDIRENADRHLFTNQVNIKCKIISGRSIPITTLDFVLSNWLVLSLASLHFARSSAHVILAHSEQTNQWKSIYIVTMLHGKSMQHTLYSLSYLCSACVSARLLAHSFPVSSSRSVSNGNIQSIQGIAPAMCDIDVIIKFSSAAMESYAADKYFWFHNNGCLFGGWRVFFFKLMTRVSNATEALQHANDF